MDNAAYSNFALIRSIECGIFPEFSKMSGTYRPQLESLITLDAHYENKLIQD